MKQVYIAGPLFTEQDAIERKREEDLIRDINNNINIFNPITQPFNEDKANSIPTAHDIFTGDTHAVLESDVILAQLDGEDPGVMMELGIAIGVNMMLDELRLVLDDETYKKFENAIPRKKIIAHTTDIRLDRAGNYRCVYQPISFNQYVIGGIEQHGEIISSHKYDVIKNRFSK